MDDVGERRSKWRSFFKDMMMIFEIVLFLVAGGLAILGYRAAAHPPGAPEIILILAAVGAALAGALHIGRRHFFHSQRGHKSVI